MSRDLHSSVAISRSGRVLLGLLLAGFLVAPALFSSAEGQEATVVGVMDGDTIRVRIGGVEDTVRLIGVDAPETRGKSQREEAWGERVKILVEKLTLGSTVRLIRDEVAGERGSMGRLLRFVKLPDGRILNEVLVKDGHARALLRFPFSQEERYRVLQFQACGERRRLWSAEGIGDRSLCAQREADAWVYVTPSGKKYHRSNCRYAGNASRKIPLREAQYHYEPCKLCRPPIK